MSKREQLLSLIKEDQFGLLKSNTSYRLKDEKDCILITSFEEIHAFVEENNREPQSNLNNMIEFQLYARLKAIREDAKKVRILKHYDFIGLLKQPEVKEITIEDILLDDPLGLLNDDSEKEIFNLKYVNPASRIKPDYLSRRKICPDFSNYHYLFTAIHDELSSKKRHLISYNPRDLKEGSFYVLDGILLFLKTVDGSNDSYDYKSGARERYDGRTLCIFDNGTQSDMLFRSLDKALQLDGYSISDLNTISVKSETVNDDDILNGYIYILKSLNPNVTHFKDLYKIGHTTGLVSERIKNARSQSTYLFHEVEVVSTFRCFNILSYNIEQTIHHFFSVVNLDIEMFNGNVSYKPREWFNVPLKVVEEVIHLILTGKLNNYYFDPKINNLVERSK
ncbi:GIY-YIG nuclease family protein [Flavobacterium sp. UW10123]|uniref:GIY-YIG nuclease family protein n=1 Tax=Flavobacterium sp. UW10123 TaxID=3230800 RepID=UPI0033945332